MRHFHLPSSFLPVFFYFNLDRQAITYYWRLWTIFQRVAKQDFYKGVTYFLGEDDFKLNLTFNFLFYNLEGGPRPTAHQAGD